MSKPGLFAGWLLSLILRLPVKPSLAWLPPSFAKPLLAWLPPSFAKPLLPCLPPLSPKPRLWMVPEVRAAAPRSTFLLPRATARALAAVILFLSACATPGPRHPSYVNPEECSPIVDAHRLDPSRSVDAPPEPMYIQLPPARDLRGVAQVEMVVKEDGFVLDDSIRVVGTDIGTTIREIREAAANWRFKPARVGICWVPAMFLFEMRRGSSSPSGPRESLTPSP